MQHSSKRWILGQIPGTVWAIGCATLFINLSSIVIFSLSPLYMTQVFGLATLKLGFLEGVTESFSWFTRIFSGILSDYLHKRKPILLVAYLLSAFSRPIFALAPGLTWIYGARITDRIANGLQATPREALVGDVAPDHLKGACYGLRQTLSVFGSLMGALGVMYLMRHTGNDYRFIFFLASLPPILAVVILWFFVKDRQDSVPFPAPILKKQKKSLKMSWRDQWKNMQRLDRHYWRLMLVAGVFTLSNYSGVYMILQAERQGLSAADVPIVMVLQNLCAMLSAFPVGYLSDKIDRRILLAAGFFVTILGNFCLGFGGSVPYILMGAALWGVQLGVNQSLLVTKVAESTPEDLRGTGFGIYYLINGIALFITNPSTGWIFQNYGPLWAFMASSVVAGFSMALIPLLQGSLSYRSEKNKG